MKPTGRALPIFYSIWTLLSFASSLYILGDILGAAAWGGVNFAVILDLFFSLAGVGGLLVGFYAAFSSKKTFAWITCVSSLGITGLSILFLYGFIFRRSPEVPLNAPLYIGSIHVPIIVLHGIAIVTCSTEAILYFLKTRNREQCKFAV